MPWNAEESLSRPELAKLQSQRLEKVCERVYTRVPFYKKKFDEKGLKPADINNIQDIVKLPFTKKVDLRDNYPYGLFAEPLENIVRIHASSGTTGKPTVVAYNRNDINLWADVMARTFTCAGVTNKDVVQNAYGYGLFTGGLGAHYGAERVGAAVIPISGGNTQKQILLLQDFGSTAICSTPSFALYIYDVACEMKINLDTIKLRVGLFGAEPWSDAMRKEIEDKLKIVATDNYGLSEVMGPGVAGECLERNGLHIAEDHFLVEWINPDTLDPVKPGEIGEMVITTLTKEAFPVIRYRTRDLTRLIPESCPCGRTMRRMTRVYGRTDDMLIIRGVNVFPQQIENVLFEIEGVAPHYQIIIDRKGALDDTTVNVEVSESMFFDEMKKQSKLKETIKKRLASELGISVEVKLVEKKTLERFEGKAKRVIDNRKF